MDSSDLRRPERITRRQFAKGLAAGTAVVAVDWSSLQAFGQSGPFTPPVLSGTHFDLSLDYLRVNFTGRLATATAINGSVLGPTLRFREHDSVTLSVTNHLKETASLHWHGMRVPADMDGVPGESFAGIAPGATFVYRFPVLQSGTYWYHSHARFQEQTGLSGALIVDRSDGRDTIEFDREYIVMLADWTDANPEMIFSNLKQESDYYNYGQLTVPDFFSAANRDGFRKTVAERMKWSRMNMSPTDISDVSGATYTYLMNGNSPKANWLGLFKPRGGWRREFNI